MALKLKPGVTLYFCRHGQTEANLAHRFSGKAYTPLTASGREQARACGLALQQALAGAGIAPAHLRYVASPLQRARVTMEIAREAMGLPRTGFEVDERIEEIDLGRWDQLTEAQARARDPAYFDRRMADKWNVPPPGGETYADVAQRLTAWATELAHDTFAVSHGAATRILRGLFAGLDPAGMSALDEPQGVVFRVRESGVEMLPPWHGGFARPGAMG